MLRFSDPSITSTRTAWAQESLTPPVTLSRCGQWLHWRKREVSSIRYLNVKDMCGSGLRQCHRAHESILETLISFNGFKSRKGQEHNVARDAKPTDGPSGLGNRLVVRGLAEGLEGKSTAQEPCGPDG
jgi:hypothetical protein